MNSNTNHYKIDFPNYLLDISAVAECYKEYGSDPRNYIMSALLPAQLSKPLLLGNIVNTMLDVWIYSDHPTFQEAMNKAFHNAPLQFAALPELRHTEDARAFRDECMRHYNNLKKIVLETFKEEKYHLNRKKAILEPSYICPQLGLQGRLDYLQSDLQALIEMKSGRANEYGHGIHPESKLNHQVQMQLYRAVIHEVEGVDYRSIHPYLLYTRYPLLMAESVENSVISDAITTRNGIVNLLKEIAHSPTIESVSQLLDSITPESLNQNKIRGRFWTAYLKPQITHFQESLRTLSPLERIYHDALFRFIIREQWKSKIGYESKEGIAGASTLWKKSKKEKEEAGELLSGLYIIENRATESQEPTITFCTKKPRPQKSQSLFSQVEEIQEYKKDSEVKLLPNFRQGDAILFYPQTLDVDSVSNHRLIKGFIQEINSDTIRVLLHATQHDDKIFNLKTAYTIEHNYMDNLFRGLINGLGLFRMTSKSRKQLLLSQRRPVFDTRYDEAIDRAKQRKDKFKEVALQTLAARDFVLLVGPPGTGKTSCALKEMVKTHLKKKGQQILLMAYTNRAVDEICESLESIDQDIDYIRIGNKISCSPRYSKHLLDKQMKSLKRVDEIHQFIENQRIFVGTIFSITNRHDLLELKHFDIAIIDEATQILEPQIIPLLSYLRRDGRNAIERFVMIGDYKQLPAVVVQDNKESVVENTLLNGIGLTNLKDSLFERLYKSCIANHDTRAIHTLQIHGRMHPEVAQLANRLFYDNQLVALGLAHQKEKTILLNEQLANNPDPYVKLLTRRTTFIPSRKQEGTIKPIKYNQDEVNIVIRLIKLLAMQYDGFTPKTLGVITSYRSQIAHIQEAIDRLNIPGTNHIIVDTVERFQGSQRDVIIYSISVNDHKQMNQLSNLIQENGHLIDRKLNVALTRAKKQLFVTGVTEILAKAPCYSDLIADKSYNMQ